MEDAASLVALFGNDTAKETIYARLALYEQSCDERLQKSLEYSNQISPDIGKPGLEILEGKCRTISNRGRWALISEHCNRFSLLQLDLQ